MKSFKFRISLWASILALVLVVGVGATVALMSAGSNSVTNQFTVAAIDTEIKENLTGGSKEVSIKNYGPSDGYVRARIMVSGVKATDPFGDPADNMVQWVTQEQASETLANVDNKVYIVFDQAVLNPLECQQGKWCVSGEQGSALDQSNGWFYYYGVLKAGKSTPKLIKKVQLSKNLEEDKDFLKDFSVTIYHESVVAIDQNLTGNSWDDMNLIMNSFLDTDIIS